MKACHLLVVLLSAAALYAQSATTAVKIKTNLGDIDVNLLTDSAPLTVANFLNYVTKGAYNGTVFHRSVPGFIIQTGGYKFASGNFTDIPQDPAVRNEFNVSNIRGTLAMAKLDGDPNSATNQFFFNLADNASNLNYQNGGFTVFGRVANAASLQVMDKIAAVPRPAVLGAPFDQIPLQNYESGSVQASNLIVVESVVPLDGPADSGVKISAIISAGSFGGAAVASPATYIEIYGENLATTDRGWAGRDFIGVNAPSVLDGVSVTIGGRAAYVSYVSPTQVNVQVPGTVPTNADVPVVLTYRSIASLAMPLKIKPLAGGLLAPPSFKVGDRQYVAALHSNGAFVSNGSIPNVAAAPAAPGETLVLYGIGFGAVTPSNALLAGQIAQGTSSLTNPVTVTIGGIPAEVTYAGRAPGYVGLYQFNVRVPVAATGDVPVVVTQAGETLPQTLYLSVQ